MVHPKHRLAGGAGHLLLLAGFASFAAWYAIDAYAAQSRVQNMLLIAPAAGLVLLLAMALAVSEIRAALAAHRSGRAPDAPVGGDFKTRYGTPVAAAGLAVYVVAMPVIGFDVATVLFIAASMVLQGARSVWQIAAFSLVMGLLPVWALETILSVPVPTLFL